MRLSYAAMAFAVMSTAALAADFPYGNWAVAEVSGAPAKASQTMTFLEDGSVSGEGGCNSFGGMYEAQGQDLAFMNVFSTQMACPDLEAEGRFFAALTAVSTWDMDGSELLLLNGDGATVLELTPLKQD